MDCIVRWPTVWASSCCPDFFIACTLNYVFGVLCKKVWTHAAFCFPITNCLRKEVITMQQTKSRWLIVLAAIGIHISIGSVYAWSVLTRPIMDAMGFTLQQVTWTFSLAILFLGTSAGFLGTYVERFGPRKSGLIAAAFLSLIHI